MAVSKTRQVDFILLRARALATLLLTSRKDLGVREEDGEDRWKDFLVLARRPRKPGIRQFGVKISGGLSLPAAEDVRQSVGEGFDLLIDRGPYPFPVCLFSFSMNEPHRHWWCWVAEPLVSPDGQPSLPLVRKPLFEPLDEDALDRIVDRVHQWYDAYYATLAGHGPANGGRRKGRGS